MSFEKIFNALPKTQCGQCGYAGCRPYAEAIAEDKAAINQCPPGGLTTLHALAELTNTTITSSLVGELQAQLKTPKVAKIREAECIGCTKCLQACPVDAIYGAAKLMHVVVEKDCTGCELCVEPCPMDCIDLIEVDALHYEKQKAQSRYDAKLVRGDFKRAGLLHQVVQPQHKPVIANDKKSYIAEALARAKAKRSMI